ncbi:hypothetical protein DID88_009243 [Monilinia fructigena]|uniref:Uncharacterized protein n=1 Tax=Monilinia fructigena TaxID=38457 RepID=A0A395IF22_9HELO|nr:hypothetical protein DID88_009243 [Monilinia fructigena]
MANPSPPKLSQSLLDRANALTTKANEAQTIFGPITTLLDSYFELQRGPLFLHEISKTPHRSLPRFQSNYGKTLRRTHCWALPPRPNTTITTPTVTPTATPLAPSCTNSLTGEPTPKPSYAQKAQNTPDTPNPTPQKPQPAPLARNH